MEEEEDVSKITSEVRDPEEKDTETEEPLGDRWDFDDRKDRWASGSESENDPESDDANEAVEHASDAKESNETHELSNRTKGMSIEIRPSDFASSKKKKKIQSSS